MVFDQFSGRVITLLHLYKHTVLFVFLKQGNVTQDPPDNIQEEGLSGASGTQSTTPITVPAIVKVRNTSFFFSFHHDG